ncbi:MAG: penicillin-binding protein 2 [Patescibacteria group bacterium]|nr:penicillin-binding protein 2 [Patescibacteria group bacterium]
MSKKRGVFAWGEDGDFGLGVNLTNERNVDPEVMYEEEILKIKERPMFVGLPLSRFRFDLAVALVLIILTSLIGRAFWIQIQNHAKFVAMAENNRLRKETVQAVRGIIRDRNGKVLADNVPDFDVAITPMDLPAEITERKDIFGRISRITGIALSDLEQDVADARSLDQKIVVARDVSYDRAVSLKIELTDAPGVSIDSGFKRRYPLSTQYPTFSHILGYVGKVSPQDLEDPAMSDYRRTDVIGKTGVESYYENFLKGKAGQKMTEVDSFGREQRVVHEQKPNAGQDLILTIDADLQEKVQTFLAQGMETAHVKRGSAIVMDPRDGSILAIASLPAYDDNIFSGRVSSTAYAAYLNDENNPLLARAWAGLFPSGSSIKPVYAVALLAEGVVTPNTTVLSTGGVWLGTRFFPDWQAGGHGVTNVRKAIAMSVNTFFYLTCGGGNGITGLGPQKMGEWLQKFGFGSRMGLDIPGEAAGLVPSPEWKLEKKKEQWYTGDTYNFAIGQGDFLVTPLQIAVATGEIANGGKELIPHVAKTGLTENSFVAGGSETLAPVSAIKTVQAGMRETVTLGSGRGLSSLPFTSAGKTGTAQWRNDKPNHAWFTVYAPYENPKVVVTVLLEEGVEGSSSAVPVARNILIEWNKIFNR